MYMFLRAIITIEIKTYHIKSKTVLIEDPYFLIRGAFIRWYDIISIYITKKFSSLLDFIYL